MNPFRKCDVSLTSTLEHTEIITQNDLFLHLSFVQPQMSVLRHMWALFQFQVLTRNVKCVERKTHSNLGINSTFRSFRFSTHFLSCAWACPCCYNTGNSSTDRLTFTRGITPFEKTAYTNGRWSIKWPSNHGEENLQIERRASPCSSTHNTNLHDPIKKGTPFINKLFLMYCTKGTCIVNFQCNCSCVVIFQTYYLHKRQVKRRSFLSSCLLVSLHIFITIMGGCLEQLKVKD